MWVYPEVRFLGDYITYHARRTPDRLALRWQGRDTSFGEFDEITSRMAAGFASLGLGRGKRVVFFGKNTEDFFHSIFAIAKSGACLAPLNWRSSVPELAAVVTDLDSSYALVDSEFKEAWAEIQRIVGKTIPVRFIDDKNTLRDWSAEFGGRALDVELSEEDPVIILYTSGTTGKPKGVMHTHLALNHSRLSEHLETAYEWREGDIFLNPLPNFHLLHISLSLQCLYNGVAISLLKQFDPQAILASIGKDRPSLLVLTPTLIQMLLDHPDAAKTNFSSVRLTMYAGSPITLGLIKRAIRAMPGKFMQFYGQTETSGPVSLLRPDEHNLEDEKKLKSCGKPLPLIALRIVDDKGNDVPDGEPGELLVRAPAASAGYWRKPEETKERFRGGWYYTGDIAYRDAEGLYYIYDRAKDMIISGGENIYSAEVENVISTHADVAAVAVIGVPDDRWGEAVKAIVIVRQGVTLTADDVIGYCRGRLANYKIPKSVDFVATFPMTGSGKVSKKDMRDPYWNAVGRKVS